MKKLTEREYEIVERVIQGKMNKEIAAELSISEQTVKNHITNILLKTELANRVQIATAYYCLLNPGSGI